MSNHEVGKLSPWRVAVLCIAALVVLVVLIASGKILESMDAGEVMVVQAPMSGELTWHTSPGIKWQGFGDITKYHKRGQFWFSAKPGEPEDESKGIKVRFNDSAHGTIFGSTAYELPLEPAKLAAMHSQYRSQESLEQQLIKPAIEKSIFLVGPLMSSKESVAERRNDLLYLIEDQIQNGVYRTQTVQEKQLDPITNQPKMVSIVRLVETKDGQKLRADKSPLTEFGIKIFNLSLNNLKYDGAVEGQIQKQQEATMQVQLAIAKAKEAEQRAITVEKEGEADAAKAKWEQEVLKARAVTEAEQKLRVAELDTKAAEQFKLRETLLGEGEAARKRAVMMADGALTQKLETYKEVAKYQADAMARHNGPIVPTVVMGGSGKSDGGGGSMFQNMLELLTVKIAKDLALDMSLTPSDSGKQLAASRVGR